MSITAFHQLAGLILVQAGASNFVLVQLVMIVDIQINKLIGQLG
jgi:hypothetical protein